MTAENAGAWSRFLLDCYGMPAIIGTWLQALVGRPGWIHVLRRQGGQPNAPVAMVRSLYHDREGWAWLGIDAPVPGVIAFWLGFGVLFLLAIFFSPVAAMVPA